MQAAAQTIGERSNSSGTRAVWADLRDSSGEDEMDGQPQTIGERIKLAGTRVAWADLRDSSCEDLLESQQALPAPLLHSESYVETPEPSFDDNNGSVLRNLQAATDLNKENQLGAAWHPNAAAIALVSKIPQAAPGTNRRCVSGARDECSLGATVAVCEAETAMSPSIRHRFRQKRRVPTTTVRHGNKRQRHNGAQCDDFIYTWAEHCMVPLGQKLEQVCQEKGISEGEFQQRVAVRDNQGVCLDARYSVFEMQFPLNVALQEKVLGKASNQHEQNHVRIPPANATLPEPTGEATEEDWQRRHDKRTNVVNSIKTTTEYASMRSLRFRGELGDAAPGTPNPHDRSISKRKWESLVMQWRNSLREYARAITEP